MATLLCVSGDVAAPVAAGLGAGLAAGGWAPGAGRNEIDTTLSGAAALK